MKKVIKKSIIAILLLVFLVGLFACDNLNGHERAEQFKSNVYTVVAESGETKQGSAVAVAEYEDGALLLSNYHVVQNADSINVSGKRAELLGYSVYHDLAVLFIKGITAQNVVFSSSSAGKNYTIGNLGGDGIRVFEGENVSESGVITTDKLVGSGRKYVPVISTYSESGKGMSGGACLNEKGELVGITTYGDIGDGVGYAVPACIAEACVNAVLDGDREELNIYGDGTIKMLNEYSYFGYRVDNRDEVTANGFIGVVQVNGINVIKTGENCPLSPGDMITEFAGIKIDGKKSIVPLYSALFTIMRDKKAVTAVTARGTFTISD